MCPFVSNMCGGINSTVAFNALKAGEKQSINISLALGETCTFKVEAKCGLPEFQPLTNVTGFDIQIVEYDDDDIDASVSAIKTQQFAPMANISTSIITKIANVSAQIKKALNVAGVKLQRETKNITAKSIIGPIAKTFNPNESAIRKFKGGLRASVTQALCKNRYQQISITPLADIANTSSRILQTVAASATYNMTIQLSTTDLQADSSAFKMGMSSFALLCISIVFAF